MQDHINVNIYIYMTGIRINDSNNVINYLHICKFVFVSLL